ncbi:MAG: DUF2634 domain-containing protein [Methanobrevibacter sp.]|nr:DUF2634 domain-containing protein [Methanobrevibacter sp.]
MELDDSIYGVDYSSTGDVSNTGDMLLVEGLSNAKQSIRNQILTEKGFYPSVDTDYGSEVYEVLGEDIEEPTFEALKIYIRNTLLDNPRVKEIVEINPYLTVNKELVVMIKVELVNGTEEDLNIQFEV